MKKNRLKVTALVLCCAMAFSAMFSILQPKPAVAAVASRQVVLITGNSVYMRTGAGTTYSRVGTVSGGTFYRYLGSATASNGKAWYKIKYSSTVEGYVSSSYAHLSTLVQNKDVQITGNPTNIRASASTSARLITSCKPGVKFRCIGQISGMDNKLWYHIDCNDSDAFVLGSLAKLVNATSTTNPTSSTTTTTKATTASTTVPTSATSATNSTTVSTTASTTTTQKPTTTTTQAQKYIVTSTGTTVNIRTGAGTNYAKIGSVNKGATFTYLGEGKDSKGTLWYKIQYTSSTVGWITSQYSKKSAVSNTGTTTPTTTPTSPNGYDTSAINSFISKTASSYGADAIQVAIIDNGVVTGTYNYGWATKNSAKVDSETIFRVASLSKTAVAVTAMKMQEEGIVDINTKIGTYWGANLPKAVTLKSLLSHTSTLKSLSYKSTKSETLAQLKSSSSYSSGTVGSSGTWMYNNYAVGIAGSTLEVAANKTLNVYTKDKIFTPLGMDASFSTGLVSKTNKIATLYSAGGSVERSVATSKSIKGSTTPGCNTTSFAGGLSCSAQDLAKMFAMLANDGVYDGKRILSASSVSTIESKLFNASEHGGSFKQCLPLRYKANLYGESELYYHTGNAYGVLALASYNPSTKDGVVVITTGASATRDSQGVYAVCSKITEYMYKNVI